MNQIEKRHFADIGALDAISFFHVLIKEGYQLSLISTKQLEALQYQLATLLTDQLNRWTGGQSSSVPVEIGQRIQQSVFYTIGYYLKNLPDADHAMEALKETSLQDLFLYGKKLMSETRAKAEKLLHDIQENCFSTDILAYNDTLAEGLPMFFSSYDLDYEAHETPASIDYPLSNDKMNLTGIDYIYVYLQKLQLENEFCRCFSNEKIHCLLRGYDRQYKELLFNVYDLILANAIGCLLLGRNEIDLPISAYDRQYLQHELSQLPKIEIGALADKAASHLIRIISLSNSQLAAYIKVSMVNLKSRLISALEVDGLKRLFLSMEEESAGSALRFEDKMSLDHDRFRRLFDDIRECRFISDKITLFHQETLSITDLIDLLESDCFFDDEYVELFDSLENIQLALLTKNLSVNPDDSSFLDEENNQEWKSSLNQFLLQMDPKRKSAILALADQIEFG